MTDGVSSLPSRVLVGHRVYLGPLICNFFRKNNFEGTFLTDEVAQWNFVWVKIAGLRKIWRDCGFFGWLPSFNYCVRICVSFVWLFQIWERRWGGCPPNIIFWCWSVKSPELIAQGTSWSQHDNFPISTVHSLQHFDMLFHLLNESLLTIAR